MRLDHALADTDIDVPDANAPGSADRPSAQLSIKLAETQLHEAGGVDAPVARRAADDALPERNDRRDPHLVTFQEALAHTSGDVPGAETSATGDTHDVRAVRSTVTSAQTGATLNGRLRTCRVHH